MTYSRVIKVNDAAELLFLLFFVSTNIIKLWHAVTSIEFSTAFHMLFKKDLNN